MSCITLIALLNGEGPYIEEWVAYHRLIGASHFVLYDNDPIRPLQALFANARDFITVIPSDHPEIAAIEAAHIQLKVYKHALTIATTPWVAMLDGDEFIVLRNHNDLPSLCVDYKEFGAVCLPWYIFGHCGHYSGPPGLVTEQLVRRRARPASDFKSITQRDAIADIRNTHGCILKPGAVAVDPQRRPIAPGWTATAENSAHINHYMCRSFENWMSRVGRGSTAAVSPQDRWRFDAETCLRQFVRITKDWNEQVDEFMRRYSVAIEAEIDRFRRPQNTPSPLLPSKYVAAAPNLNGGVATTAQ